MMRPIVFLALVALAAASQEPMKLPVKADGTPYKYSRVQSQGNAFGVSPGATPLAELVTAVPGAPDVVSEKELDNSITRVNETTLVGFHPDALNDKVRMYYNSTNVRFASALGSGSGSGSAPAGSAPVTHPHTKAGVQAMITAMKGKNDDMKDLVSRVHKGNAKLAAKLHDKYKKMIGAALKDAPTKLTKNEEGAGSEGKKKSSAMAAVKKIHDIAAKELAKKQQQQQQQEEDAGSEAEGEQQQQQQQQQGESGASGQQQQQQQQQQQRVVVDRRREGNDISIGN